MPARLKDPGDFAERKPWRELVQRLRRGDDIEVAGQERQGLDPADDMSLRPQAGGQLSDQVDRPIDAEHLMSSVGEHCGKTTPARSKIKYAHGFRTDHPGDR